MRIDNATIFCLRIPFVEAFRHSSSTRNYSDSIVVRLTADDGTVGYGEGVARPYVTGETVESVVSHIANRLWPAVADANLSAIFERHDPLAGLSSISEALPDQASNSCSDDDADGVIAWHGARTAVELALIDCLLRSAGLSIGKLLPPRRDSVTYSGVITAGPVDAAVRHARYLKLFGLKNLKIKIGTVNPLSELPRSDAQLDLRLLSASTQTALTICQPRREFFQLFTNSESLWPNSQSDVATPMNWRD